MIIGLAKGVSIMGDTPMMQRFDELINLCSMQYCIRGNSFRSFKLK
jgi:hypothetical protein